MPLELSCGRCLLQTPVVALAVSSERISRVMSPMKFPVKCSGCGHLNQFEWSQVGQAGECSRCGKVFTVPAPLETSADAEPPPPPRVKFRCPACRRKFATKPEMAGQKIRCTGCGAGVRVPHPDGAVEMPSSQPGVFEFALSDELPIAAELPRSDVARADARVRPSAGPAAKASAKASAESSVQSQAGPRSQASGKTVAAAVTPRVDVRQVDTTPTKNDGPGPSLSTAELETLVGLSGAGRRARAETVALATSGPCRIWCASRRHSQRPKPPKRPPSPARRKSRRRKRSIRASLIPRKP